MGAITFAVKAPPVPEWSGWTDFTDPVYWTVTEGSWDGSKWIGASTMPGPTYNWKVEPLGTGPLGAWWENAKPTYFRITFTGSGIELSMYNTSSEFMFHDLNYLNLEEKEIDYAWPGTPDMRDLQLISFPNPLEITKIEFYAP